MTEPERTIGWETTALHYLDALDAGDAAALAELWEQAAINPQLEQVLGELTDGLAAEEDMDLAWQTGAEQVRLSLREHPLGEFPDESQLPPVTVGKVATRLEEDHILGGRLSAEDKDTNKRLRDNATLLPDDLGLPHFEKWITSLSIRASARYWRAFRQAAVLLRMGRCQQVDELAAARQAGRSPRGGRS